MVSYLRQQPYIWCAWRQGNFTVTPWKPIILDVIASISRTIFKRRESFSHLDVFTVEYLLNCLFILKNNCLVWSFEWYKKFSNLTRNNKRPKGPHIVHLSTMCHLFWEICQGGHFCLLIGPNNTNMVEDVEILLPVKFHWIPFSEFRWKVKNV